VSKQLLFIIYLLAISTVLPATFAAYSAVMLFVVAPVFYTST